MVRIQQSRVVFHPGTANENVAIRDLNLQIETGSFVTVVGSNGAGKSTLLNLISGGLMPTSGGIFIDDVDVTKQPEYRRAMLISRIFQNPLSGTAANMTLEENMAIAWRKGTKGLQRSLNARQREYFRRRLAPLHMELEERMRDIVGLLSGGQRQALTLLMAILSDPLVLLLDEHTAALDPRNAQLVLELTDQFVRERHLTTVMVTHNMQQAIQYGNRLLMMDRGEVILDASGEEKRALTVEGLIDAFHTLRHRELDTDTLRLSEE